MWDTSFIYCLRQSIKLSLLRLPALKPLWHSDWLSQRQSSWLKRFKSWIWDQLSMKIDSRQSWCLVKPLYVTSLRILSSLNWGYICDWDFHPLFIVWCMAAMQSFSNFSHSHIPPLFLLSIHFIKHLRRHASSLAPSQSKNHEFVSFQPFSVHELNYKFFFCEIRM